MAHWIDVCAVYEVPEDRPLGRTVEGVSLVLVRRGEQIAAVADRCPHFGFPLRHGTIRDDRLVCALHGWKFDVFGAPPPELPPEARCEHFRVRVEATRVFVDLSPDIA